MFNALPVLLLPYCCCSNGRSDVAASQSKEGILGADVQLLAMRSSLWILLSSPNEADVYWFCHLIIWPDEANDKGDH